ncbi:MAG: L,D-transpeptidase family protein [Pseudomonadota bacterium]|uniref:L,D-transpeptidase n=1 Tax=Thermithiobacillus tepidarius TaxID=929 RepID=UPI00048CC24C|nr:L,D-transpeptidase [Thermithiobacillus tepidarius]
MSPYIEVCSRTQRLFLRDADGGSLASYPVSTAANGLGETAGSYRTPRGRHYVRARIGAGLPLDAVLVGRRWTGEIYTTALGHAHPGRDWILTRILWLCGLEPGFNRGGAVDTFRRYIYIHGTPDLDLLGTPASHGCIRMDSRDVLALFDRTPAGTPVTIDG